MEERNKIALILSFIAVFFGIVAIITSRPYLLKFDTVGIMVTILCGLVALLIGWNIYTVIDVRNITERINNNTEHQITQIEQQFNEKIDKEILKISSDVGNELKLFKRRLDQGEALLQANIATALAASIDNTNIDKNFLFLMHSLSAIVLWENCNEYGNADASISLLINVLRNERVILTDGQSKSIERQMARIKGDNIKSFDKLLDFVSKIKKNHA